MERRPVEEERRPVEEDRRPVEEERRPVEAAGVPAPPPPLAPTVRHEEAAARASAEEAAAQAAAEAEAALKAAQEEDAAARAASEAAEAAEAVKRKPLPEVCVDPTQVCVDPTQVCVNSTQVYVNSTQVTPASVELFAALAEVARVAQLDEKSVFDHFDGDGDGELTAGELGRLLQTLLPTTATASSLRYFQVRVELGILKRVRVGTRL